MEKKVPTYKYKLSNDFVLTAVSMVEDPAVQHNCEYFSKKRENFSVQDGNVIGVAVLCDVPIPRMDAFTNSPYYIVFDKPTCDNLAQQILRKGLPLTLDHADMEPLQAQLTGVFQTSPAVKFQDVPDGSVIVSYKASPEVIDELKKRNGFSIELFFGDIQPFSKVDEILTFIDNG